MTIRQATVADLPALRPCAEQFHSETEHLTHFDFDCFKDSWEKFLSANFGVILVAEEDGAIRGAIGGIVYPDSNNGRKVMQEGFWFVLPEWRKCGGLLYRAFERLAVQSGFHEIRMGFLVDSMPERVERFYQDMGYRRVEVNYRKELTA